MPFSGAGAASAGGRFNRSGVEALYFSAEPETALAEYRRGSRLPLPATLAAFALDLADVVDLSAGLELRPAHPAHRTDVATHRGNFINAAINAAAPQVSIA